MNKIYNPNSNNVRMMGVKRKQKQDTTKYTTKTRYSLCKLNLVPIASWVVCTLNAKRYIEVLGQHMTTLIISARQ